MEKDIVNIKFKRIEQKLSQIGAEIAVATDMSQQAKKMTSGSEAILINAQKEIEALYASLEDDGPSEAYKN